MLGINAKKSIGKWHQPFLKELFRKSHLYIHGAGLSVQGSKDTWMHRSLSIASESKHLMQFENAEIKEKLLLAHLRVTLTLPAGGLENLQPFEKTLVSGSTATPFMFAHNGKLSDGYEEKLPVDKKFARTGSTDSEWAFFYVLTELQKSGFELNKYDDFKRLHAIFASMNEFGSLNCIMCDGSRMFAYYDKGRPKGMYYMTMEPFRSDNAIALVGTRINENSTKGFNKFMEENRDSGKPEIRKIISEMEKLRPVYEPFMPYVNEWKELTPGNLAVFSKGKLAYQGA